MTLYFPDVNVWLALSVEGHVHNAAAIHWLMRVRQEDRLVFNRYTQLGLLRLLTNVHVVEPALTILEAWAAFDEWLGDPRIDFYPEPRSVDTAFRQTSAPFSGQSASKWIGDCYLLAFARESNSTLVTFDQALLKLAVSTGDAAIIPE